MTARNALSRKRFQQLGTLGTTTPNSAQPQRTAFVHVQNAATGEEAFRRPTAAYLRRPELERYFAGNPAAWFVAESLTDLGSREQWAALGVAGKPRRLGDELALSAGDERHPPQMHPKVT